MSLPPYKMGVAALLLALPAWPQALTVTELLTKAEQSNRDVAATRQRVEEARGLLLQAGIRPALTLESSAASGRPLGTVGEEQFSAGLSKTLERGSKRDRRLEVAEARIAIAANDYEERVRQLRFELRLRYAEYAGESARLTVIARLIDSLRQSIGLMRARVDRGDAAALDAGLLQADLSRVEAQQVGIQGRLLAARSELARLSGFASGEEPMVEPEFLPAPAQDRDLLLSRALAERPDLKMARLEGAQGDAERRLAEAEGHANATLSASYTFVKSRMDDTFGVDGKGSRVLVRDRDDILSVGVSIPLFAKNRNQGAIEASVARTRGAELRREYLERSIPLEVESALRRLAAARNTLDALSGAAIRQMEANLNVMQQAYELGQLRLLDVLTEQRRLLDTQLGRADAISDVLRGWAELEKAVGGLLQ